jgi:hypothetical protein
MALVIIPRIENLLEPELPQLPGEEVITRSIFCPDCTMSA